ncbi:MAG: hypothetical protein Q8P02_03710, partial [Candidatus Micrarchaeota archaeon]|nr:hypothetical protein [Candidatus Micrarchaeota archaeon]
AGNLNRSDVRLVTFTDDATAPSISLVSPLNGVTLSGTPSFVFNQTDAVSATAACTLWVDSVIAGYNGSVNNATATTLTSNVSLASTGHSWFVQCTDGAANSANSSANGFLLVTSGGSSPTPTPVPSPTPAPTAAPVVTVTPVPSATPVPSPAVSETASATPVPTPPPEVVSEEEVVVDVQEPATGSASGEPAAAPKVTVRQAVSGVGLSGRGNAVRSSYAVFLENKGNQSLSNVEVTQRFPFIIYRGPSPDDYPEIEWNPRPVRILPGSAVVTWLFDEVKPGEEVKAEAGFKEQDVSKDEVAQLAAPKVLAQSVREARTGSATASAPAEPTPAGFDFTVPAAVVALLLLAGGAYFFTRRKSDGL